MTHMLVSTTNFARSTLLSQTKNGRAFEPAKGLTDPHLTPHSTAQHDTAQHSTIRDHTFSTAHSTAAQHSTAQKKTMRGCGRFAAPVPEYMSQNPFPAPSLLPRSVGARGSFPSLGVFRSRRCKLTKRTITSRHPLQSPAIPVCPMQIRTRRRKHLSRGTPCGSQPVSRARAWVCQPGGKRAEGVALSYPVQFSVFLTLQAQCLRVLSVPAKCCLGCLQQRQKPIIHSRQCTLGHQIRTQTPYQSRYRCRSWKGISTSSIGYSTTARAQVSFWG